MVKTLYLLPSLTIIRIVQSNGQVFGTKTHLAYIFPYVGMRRETQLPVQLLSSEIEKELKERGKKYVEFTTGSP